MQTLEQFGQTIKKKYPQYSDLSDLELGQKMLAKYPQYNDMVSTETTTKKPSVGGFVSNVVSSAGNIVKGIGGAVVNTFNPDINKNTISNIGRTIAGGISELPGVSQIYNSVAKGGKDNSVLKGNREAFNNVVNFYSQRYGGKNAPEVLKNISKTAYEDPVGFALDVSTLITGLGGATNIIGKAGKLESVVNVGQKISKVGEITNPVNLGVKSLEKSSELLGKGLSKARNVTFGITTGKGSETALQAYQAGVQGGESGKLFLDTMRGKISKSQVVENTRDVLGSIYEKRSDAYKTGLAVIQEETKGVQLHTAGAREAANKALSEIGVPIKQGKLDFSARPSLDSKGINNVIKTIDNWDDFTPLGLNQLKQEIEGFRKGGVNLNPADNRFNRFIDSTTKNLDNYLEINVPGIKQLNTKYKIDTEFIKDMRRDLLSKDPSAESTALTKMTSALKSDNNFKLDILEEAKSRTGVDLSKQIAGVNLGTFMPGGIPGKLYDIYTILHGISALIDPKVLLSVASTSPRLAGEFLYGLGFAKRNINPILNALRKIPQSEINALSKASYYARQSEPNK